MSSITLPELRRSLRQARQQIPASTRTQYDVQINQRIIRSRLLLRQPRIASYMAHNGEPSLERLIIACSERHLLHYLPTLTNKQTLLFTKYSWGDKLKYNRFNIEEANTTSSISSKFLSMILVPLVGYDKLGNRLGAGGGYYDRTLSYSASATCTLKPLLVGIAYSHQEVDKLATQPWDIPLDAVINERQIICFSNRAASLLSLY
ncbi:MAG: 5-formyltetrahydrofolate cyclo-ligase [Piscirickettsiaceae bacterium]|nr:MAG: 5-formyltetrahydrofolate cyclo-ligase [Piscirickettsiaceae bacterium]